MFYDLDHTRINLLLKNSGLDEYPYITEELSI
jgi:hypothetical protein